MKEAARLLEFEHWRPSAAGRDRRGWSAGEDPAAADAGGAEGRRRKAPRRKGRPEIQALSTAPKGKHAQFQDPHRRRTSASPSRARREHNLKNVDLVLPRNKLIVMTGLSGSGKSSLAFDTIFADGQRRYMESLSSYARQFLGQMEKPDVDEITGLSPAISIDQKTTSHNPRSTVGTVTEIYDYLRLMYARIGVPHCPVCGRVISQQSGGRDGRRGA